METIWPENQNQNFQLPESPRKPMEFLSRSWSAAALQVSKTLHSPLSPLVPKSGLATANDGAAMGDMNRFSGVEAAADDGNLLAGNTFSFASSATSQLVLERIMSQSDISPLASGRLSHSSGPLNATLMEDTDTPPISPSDDYEDVVKATSFDHSSSPEFELFSDHESLFEEGITKTITEPTMEKYIMKTQKDYGSGVARPKFDEDAKFELKAPSEGGGSPSRKPYPLILRTPRTLFRPDPDRKKGKVAFLRTLPLWRSSDYPLKEEEKTLEEAYYTQFGVPFPQAGRNQGASIKALEIQIGKMSKVLQERGSGSLPSSTETNPRDHVVLKELKKLKVNSTESTTSLRRLLKEKLRIEEEVKAIIKVHCLAILEDALPPKEKDQGSFTLP
nr:VAN3-binding protein-like [Tanacetum cinerariifolium]